MKNIVAIGLILMAFLIGLGIGTEYEKHEGCTIPKLDINLSPEYDNCMRFEKPGSYVIHTPTIDCDLVPVPLVPVECRDTVILMEYWHEETRWRHEASIMSVNPWKEWLEWRKSLKNISEEKIIEVIDPLNITISKPQTIPNEIIEPKNGSMI